MLFLNDLRYGARSLVGRPGFTLVALAVLALGIGANTAIFSLVRAVLDPLPYPEPERLYFLWGAAQRDTLERRSVSHPDFLDWRRSTASPTGAPSFAAMSAFANPTCTVGRGDDVERVRGELVSADYFRLLGVAPVRGRAFSPREDESPGEPVVMIGHALWQSRFGGGDLVGKTLVVNAVEHSVIGVMPEGFRGLTGQARLWLPMGRQSAAIPELAAHDPEHRRDLRWHAVLARLAGGVSPERAEAELRAVAETLAREHPATNARTSALMVPVGEQLLGDLRPAAVVLLLAVIFVLAIACANLANLLLARALDRRRETAIRLALGAGRRHLIRRWLAESVLLAGVGGLLGLGLAFFGLRALATMLAGTLPSYLRMEVDPLVLVFTLGLTLLTGVLLGLAPALAALRVAPQEQLKEEGGGTAGGRGRLRGRSVLLVAEIALATVLLIATGLMVRGFQNMQSFDPGFEPEERLALRLDLPLEEFPPPRIVTFTRRLEERLGGLPSVVAVARSSDIPFGGRSSANFAQIEGWDPPGPEEEVRIYQHMVGPGYFDALGIELLRGRDFTSADGAESAGVAVVSAAMADRFWPGVDPLGRLLKLGRASQEGPWLSVVGVVEDVAHRNLLDDPNADPDVYFPFDQHPSPSLALVLRTRADSLAEVRREVREFAPGAPLYDVATLEERLGRETFNLRFGARLMTLFGLLALALAAMGVYGVMAYSVSQRRREFAVRVALGSSTGAVARLALGEGLRLAGIGVVLGGAVAPVLTGILASQLPGVDAIEPLIFALIALLLLGAALLASYLPARRAGRVDPVEALRA